MAYFVTNAARTLAPCLGLEHAGADALGIVSVMIRHARSLERLAVEECNGPAWLDHRTARPGELERWGERIEARQERLAERLGELMGELAATVPEFDGVMVEVGGDPRGYVVRIVWPEDRGAVHYARGTACTFRTNSPHCNGGEHGTLRAVGLA